jgi:hypothetical protein
MSLFTKSTSTLLLFVSIALAQPQQAAREANPAPPPVLDQKVEQLNISGAEIADALADIGKQVGISITLDERVLDLLPWGKQTKLSEISVSNASLREILPQILGPLGMTWESRDGGIVVVPTDPIKRLNRRSTWDDLKLLKRATEQEYTPENFATYKVQYRITSKVDAAKMLEHQLSRSGRGTIAEMLETATGALGWIWFPEDDHIVIRTGQAQVANLLSRRVTARYANVPLSQILTDLADKADVALSMEPGMMTKLPPSTAQSYTLFLQSSSIRQAFESIAAETGLKYEITNDGVHVSLSGAVADAGKTGGRPSPYVAKLVVPGAAGKYSMEFFIRQDELPPDILEYYDQMLGEMIQKLRSEMAPSVEPAHPRTPGQ